MRRWHWPKGARTVVFSVTSVVATDLDGVARWLVSNTGAARVALGLRFAPR